MSLRRGYYGVRQPRPLADEMARFLGMNSITIFHQKRNLANKCTSCWDDLLGDYSPACDQCGGSGFTIISTGGDNLPRKRAYGPLAQPAGNAGNAGQFFKAGGQHTRYSAYIYFDLNTGRDIERGDRLIVKHSGIRQELVVMNNLPQLAGAVQLGFVSECTTASNVVLDEVVG